MGNRNSGNIVTVAHGIDLFIEVLRVICAITAALREDNFKMVCDHHLACLCLFVNPPERSEACAGRTCTTNRWPFSRQVPVLGHYAIQNIKQIECAVATILDKNLIGPVEYQRRPVIGLALFLSGHSYCRRFATFWTNKQALYCCNRTAIKQSDWYIFIVIEIVLAGAISNATVAAPSIVRILHSFFSPLFLTQIQLSGTERSLWCGIVILIKFNLICFTVAVEQA